MQDDLVVRISKIHAVQHNVPLQTDVICRAAVFVKMLPRPDSGSLFCFRQPVSRFFYIDKRYITVVCFRMFIQQGKNPLRPRHSHNDAV